MRTSIQKKAAVAATLLLVAAALFAGGSKENAKEASMSNNPNNLTESAAQNAARLGIGPGTEADAALFQTDAEFMSAFYNFAYGEALDEARA